MFVATLVGLCVMYAQSVGVHSGRLPPDWLCRFTCLDSGRSDKVCHLAADDEVVGNDKHRVVEPHNAIGTDVRIVHRKCETLKRGLTLKCASVRRAWHGCSMPPWPKCAACDAG